MLLDFLSPDLAKFLVGAAFNLAVAVLIVRLVYFPATRSKSYVFSFLVFNTVIFAVLSLLGSVEIGVGLGFGLFAIFSVLNYRTDEMPIREMTYLFTLIALPVMNALMGFGEYAPQALAANAAIVAVMFVLEKGWGFRFEQSQKLTYDSIELIAPAQRERLIADLRERTGLPVTRVEVGKVDLLRDAAELTVYYEAAEPRRQPEPAPRAVPVSPLVTT